MRPMYVLGEMGEATQIAKREWSNIRTSLEVCGDIGEFYFESLFDRDPRFKEELCLLTTTLKAMDRKLQKHGYSTPEALSIFTAFATIAAERLGLRGVLTLAFGTGYGYVRTGWFWIHGNELQQVIFCKLFFPLGSHYEWEFDSEIVKKKFKVAFDKFTEWQNNPKLHLDEIRDFAKYCNGFLPSNWLAPVTKEV